MSNIFDVFNSRKEGLDYLCEGYEVSDARAFKNLDVAMGVLDSIVNESTNEMIELQSAMYLEDLVLESIMYENFQEEEMTVAIEATIKERANSVLEFLKKQWKKLQEWFASLIKTIVNFFTSGEKLVEKYKNTIPQAMKQCKVKVKIHDYADPKTAINEAFQTFITLSDISTNPNAKTKDYVMSVVKCKDKNELVDKVRRMYVKSESPKETPISSLDPNIAMKYVADKKAGIECLKKMKKENDDKFKEQISKVKEIAKGDENGVYSLDQVKVFNFANGLTSTVIKTQIACIRKAASDYTAVIRKALSKAGKLEKSDAVEVVDGGREEQGGTKALPAPSSSKKQNMKSLPGGGQSSAGRVHFGPGGKNDFVAVNNSYDPLEESISFSDELDVDDIYLDDVDFE